jgi:hypothetical protein
MNSADKGFSLFHHSLSAHNILRNRERDEMNIFVAVFFSISSIFSFGSSGDGISKSFRYIVDIAGGGTSIGWRDAGDDGPGPRWSGGVLFY